MNPKQQNRPNATKLEHWAEWFEKCALAKCGEEAREAMSKFAWARYRKLLEEVLGKMGVAEEDHPPELNDLLAEDPRMEGGIGSCWHDLESSVWYAPKPRGEEGLPNPGVTYKKFYRTLAAQKERAEGPVTALEVLEGSTTDHLIKTRCRKLLRAAKFVRGLGPEKAGSDPAAFKPLQDWRESRHNEPMGDEDALSVAQGLLEVLDEGQRILVLARMRGANLSHDSFTSHFGCGKTRLYEMQKRALGRLQRQLETVELGSLETRQETGQVFGVLFEILQEWHDSAECAHLGLFIKDETGDSAL